MWSERNVLDSLLWEAAVDDMGIYPRAVISGEGEALRTEWQDGWNAAVMKITEKHGLFRQWERDLTDVQRVQLRELLDADDEPILLRARDGVPSLAIVCGDTFAYACADAESFTLSELSEVYRLWKAHGYVGLVAWIACKRQDEPIKEYRYASGYRAAKADVSAVE